jgi:hypothetical protein
MQTEVRAELMKMSQKKVKSRSMLFIWHEFFSSLCTKFKAPDEPNDKQIPLVITFTPELSGATLYHVDKL